ncbi:acylphosphatase [Candidatus Parcubacteria bacterium]|nr:MAG: acylphosphatase [Candidatus Parcubacteria bacterium]
MEEKHLDIKIFGKVQGVGFREFIKERAIEFGINGTVRNNEKGYVEVEAEGEEDSLSNFVEECRKGSNWAEVIDVKTEDGKMKNYSSFSIMM